LSAAWSPSEQPFQVAVRDISAGGLCIVTTQALPVSAPLRCELRIPGIPTSIPTLAQVRWVKDVSPAGVEMGLQFLL